VIVSGFCFASAIRSARLRKRWSAFTAITSGKKITVEIIWKSSTGLNGSERYSAPAVEWPPVSMISVVPSGVALATWSDAMVPPAPGRLSTITGLPSRCARPSATMRAMTSALPPAAKPCTSVTGRFG